MGIPEKLVAAVVSDVSERMADPSYAQVAIGTFVQAQPDVSRFVTAHSDELGGGEGVIHAVFHAEVLAECFRRHRDRATPPIGFPELDAVAHGDPIAELTRLQPALASYLASNVDSEPVRRVVAHVGLALDAAGS